MYCTGFNNLLNGSKMKTSLDQWKLSVFAAPIFTFTAGYVLQHTVCIVINYTINILWFVNKTDSGSKVSLTHT